MSGVEQDVYLLWYRAADAFSGGARLVGIFHDRAKAEAWGDEHYAGYGPTARDYSISVAKFLDAPGAK